MRNLLAFGFVLLVLGACQPKETIPTVEILSPEEGATIMGGGETRIQVTISDEDELHDYEITIMNTTTNKEVFYYDGHEHTQNLMIDTTVTLDVTEHSDMTLTVMASNHGGGETTQAVSFHHHPQ